MKIEDILQKNPSSLRLGSETNMIDNHLVTTFKTQEGYTAEGAYCLGYNRQKYIIALSTQIGCPMKCHFCEVTDLPYRRSLTAQELEDEAVIITQRAVANGFSITDKPIKVAFVEMGEPFMNKYLPEGIERITGILPAAVKVSTTFPDHKTAYENAEKIIQFASTYNRPVQMQISLHSTNEDYRRSVCRFPLADFKTIAEFGEAFKKYGNGKRKVNLSFTLNKKTPCKASDIIDVFSPEYFAVRLRDMLSTEPSEKNSLDRISFEEISRLEQEFKQAGYYSVPGLSADIEAEFNLNPGMLSKMEQRGESIVLPEGFEERIKNHEHVEVD